MQQKLKEVLSNIPDAYSDFKESVYKDLRNSDENIQKLLDFMKDNPTTKTDDEIDYIFDEIVV